MNVEPSRRSDDLIYVRLDGKDRHELDAHVAMRDARRHRTVLEVRSVDGGRGVRTRAIYDRCGSFAAGPARGRALGPRRLVERRPARAFVPHAAGDHPAGFNR
ncbi:MAG: hypothetical protein E6J91_50165 [Deltaproteobacteria bacterium]|nr:MAG: hypothetical protein E6J91_50165 [Deltaproteobacteria bacterium]